MPVLPASRARLGTPLKTRRHRVAENGGTSTCVVAGERIARYGFPDGHPFGPDRHDVFWRELVAQGLDRQVLQLAPRRATREELLLFHDPGYVDFVVERSATGEGLLDAGDTPAFKGVFEAACDVVGASLVAAEAVLRGDARRGFVPIAGLHHAGRAHAAGFCVFNDIGVVVEHLKRAHGLSRIAYVDIDAHHGDGVFYAFEDDPSLIVADTHEDGRYLYPGTGAAAEIGTGAASGSKLNLPLAPGAGDADFLAAWPVIEAHLERHAPEFVIFQCGADSLGGDPIAHLGLSEDAHGQAAARLCAIADRHASGRILGFGGGGYNRRNIARAWTRVVQAFVEAA
jgi:acetoin utilization protein AcuC